MRKTLSLLLLACCTQASAKQLELNFDIYLNEDPIGVHRVQIDEAINERRVKVEAQMAVEFLFLTAFSYQHRADEVWQGDCISTLQTQTNEDGELFRVEAERIGDALNLTTQDQKRRLEGCIRTFAYWNPDLLDQAYLLNTQNGAYEAARLIELTPQPLRFNGKQYGSRHYRLEVGDDIRIFLWYDQDRSWRALQTEVSKGRVLRYVRQEG